MKKTSPARQQQWQRSKLPRDELPSDESLRDESSRKVLSSNALLRNASLQKAELLSPIKKPAHTPHISKFLWQITKRGMRRRGFADNILLQHWQAIVGDQLAALSQPVRLSRSGAGVGSAAGSGAGTGTGTGTGQATGEGVRPGGVLTIRVEGAMALELQHLAPQIIDKINGYYGHAAIGKLHIIQGPVRRPTRQAVRQPLRAADIEAQAQHMADIAHPRLRRALARLRLRIGRESG